MKPPIVILHGWGLSQKKFEPLIHEFEKRGYTVFAPDFPGFGKSNIPTNPLTLTDYAQFLHLFLEKHTVKNPVLVGHSFGGRVSLRYSTMYPKSIRTLILTGTPGYTPISKKKLRLFIALAKLGYKVFSLPLLFLAQDAMRKWYYYLVGAREFYRAEGPMRQTFKNIVVDQLEEDMKQIGVRCLLLWGENDQIIPVSIAQRMLETIPGSSLRILPNTTHGVPFNEPKRFVDEVDAFLKKNKYS